MKINIFWFRNDLRLDDNTALASALKKDLPVLTIYIFDRNIISDLQEDDPGISFIHCKLSEINKELNSKGSSLKILIGDPEKIWSQLLKEFDINEVFVNREYEPYSIERDDKIATQLKGHNVFVRSFKDMVIFEYNEILKSDGKPYTVFTPYKTKWLRKLKMGVRDSDRKSQNQNFYKFNIPSPSLEETGFRASGIRIRHYDLSVIKEYHKFRDYPALDKTSYLSAHLRYGTVSIRKIVSKASDENSVFLSELIWREFFIQILCHFPETVTNNFRKKYDNIKWRNDPSEFRRWQEGETGYPIIDAGMRQLNETGYMHNRVRMITAGFLCKHLLTDWRLGEAYFARKLLDFELSSNVGNWQWAAGTGCDAAPYFRIFNPHTQQKRFDPAMEYCRKWIRNLEDNSYPRTIVDHKFARERALEAYHEGVGS